MAQSSMAGLSLFYFLVLYDKVIIFMFFFSSFFFLLFFFLLFARVFIRVGDVLDGLGTSKFNKAWFS
jgi:hypothetical protein